MPRAGVDTEMIVKAAAELVDEKGIETITLKDCLVRAVMAHGFASVESHRGFSHPFSVESSYEYALDMFFLGIKTRQEQNTD